MLFYRKSTTLWKIKILFNCKKLLLLTIIYHTSHHFSNTFFQPHIHNSFALHLATEQNYSLQYSSRPPFPYWWYNVCADIAAFANQRGKGSLRPIALPVCNLSLILSSLASTVNMVVSLTNILLLNKVFTMSTTQLHYKW